MGGVGNASESLSLDWRMEVVIINIGKPGRAYLIYPHLLVHICHLSL